jgi:hypothetical protein
MIGGDWDEFSAQYVNDTTSVTVSANGTAKSYNAYTPYPVQSNNPLINYLVLIIQVSGYITLASGATAGSATVSVVFNGTTLYSTTISNTNNQLIINQIIPYSKFPSGYQKNWYNTLQIDVTLGSGTASVTITRVQFMFGILLNGGSNGLTIQIPISQQITFINDDPNIFTSPSLSNAFGLGVFIAHYDPFGITTGQATYNINSGQSILVLNSTSSIWVIRAMPTTVSNNTASGTLTITVGANESVLIGYFVFSIIINGINVAKGHLREDLYIRYIELGNPDNGIQFTNGGFGLAENLFTSNSKLTFSFSQVINQVSLGTGNFNWGIYQSYGNQTPAKQVGNSYLYLLSNTTPKALIHIDTITYSYSETDQGNGVFGNGSFGYGGMAIARIAFVEVEE